MKAAELIYDSYVMGNVIAEEGQNLTAVQLSTGVRLLNYVINTINKDGAEISLNAQENVILPQGATSLLLPNYIKLNKVQFDLGSVWVDTEMASAEDFYNVARIRSVNSIPYYGYAKRTADGMELIFYFTPERDYEIRIISGLKKITNLSADDELSMDELFYEELLVWELANYLRIRNQLGADEEIKALADGVKSRLRKIKTRNINVKLSRIGTCNSRSSSTEVMKLVADANIMRGFRV